MKTCVSKHGRDAGELEWVAKELAASEGGACPAPQCFCSREACKCLALIDTLRSQALSIPKELLIAPEFLEADFAPVPGPQVRGKVQAPIHIREIIDDSCW